MSFWKRVFHKQEVQAMSDTNENLVEQTGTTTEQPHVVDQWADKIGSAMNAVTTTIEEDHALLDKVQQPLKEILKVANFNVDPIWGTVVDLAKKLDADTGAALAAANDTVDVFQRLGYTLKIFGHDVEGIWGSAVSAVKNHLK